MLAVGRALEDSRQPSTGTHVSSLNSASVLHTTGPSEKGRVLFILSRSIRPQRPVEYCLEMGLLLVIWLMRLRS
jgi:hypothetical protein